MLSNPSIQWPAEWETQQAVWFSWPHRADTWAGKIDSLEKKFAEIITLASRFQTVKINASKHLWKRIEKALPTLANIELFDHATNDVWCRDHGATFVLSNGLLQATDFCFNAWGGKFPPWNLDDQVAKHMASATNARHYRSTLTLEGGAIEGNGNGVLITTEAVALNPNRNPDWSKIDVEQELQKCLGVSHIHWLRAGIEGDDTDGHIDDLSRFIQEDALVTAVASRSSMPNYSILEENKERLQDLRTLTGSSVQLIELPMPDPIHVENWRLPSPPASYANFLILNGAVLVPTFGQTRNDDRALGILRECFANREIIGIDCRELILEGGALHCISQQEPKASKV